MPHWGDGEETSVGASTEESGPWVTWWEEHGFHPVYTQTAIGWDVKLTIGQNIFTDKGSTQNAAAFKLYTGPAGNLAIVH